jgi:hypothetical protein
MIGRLLKWSPEMQGNYENRLGEPENGPAASKTRFVAFPG